MTGLRANPCPPSGWQSVLPFAPLSMLLRAGLCLLLAWFVQTSAHGQTGLKIRLVPEVTGIAPGEPFYVGLFIQHEPGWHTYWRQPGIVGVPTSLAWSLPAGFAAGPLEYPEPEATKMFHIKAQGYERDVLLQTRITPPADLKPGQKVKLTGKAAWMCCGNTCHPGSMNLHLELPVVAAGKVDLDPRWHPVFEKERAAYAKPSTAWTARAEEKGMVVTLDLAPVADAPEGRARPLADPVEAAKVLFFTEDGWINSDEPQTVELRPDGSLRITLHRAEVFLGKGTPERLLGVLQRAGGWHSDGSLRSMVISPVLSR